MPKIPNNLLQTSALVPEQAGYRVHVGAKGHRMRRTTVQHYHDHGYAVVRGVFDRHEVRELAEGFDRLYAQGIDHGASYRHQNVFFRLAADPVLGQIVRMVQWPAYVDEVFARYRIDLRMRDVLAPLIGSDLKQIIHQLHWKPPGATNVEFGYHQDIKSRRPRAAYRAPERSYVQTGIAIDAHRIDNGAMVVLPGSHKRGELCLAEESSVMDRALSDGDLCRLGLDPASKVILELDPGDVALWHLHLVHGSGPNTSHSDRRFLINGYVTAANCTRGEWAFRGGMPCALGEPVLVHYEDLYTRPEPHYVS
jgi:ectoine hydroxylase-related dioxygenase (phytanoyl-CoA dioxygenase family)